MAVAVEHDPSRRAWDIWIMRQMGPRLVKFQGADGEWTEYPEDGRERIPPTYHLDDITMLELIEEMGKHGVRADEHVRGKLAATEAHLADLRSLLGLGDKAVHPCVR